MKRRQTQTPCPSGSWLCQMTANSKTTDSCYPAHDIIKSGLARGCTVQHKYFQDTLIIHAVVSGLYTRHQCLQDTDCIDKLQCRRCQCSHGQEQSHQILPFMCHQQNGSNAKSPAARAGTCKSCDVSSTHWQHPYNPWSW